MDNKTSIRLAEISKKYILHHEKPTLAENIIRRHTSEEFWALKKINLEIKKGARLGIIGSNGSGKTTLLKIIAGITTPTEGEVTTAGKIVSLIDIEAGFHPDLTGEENIFLNGLLIGMSKKEISTKIKAIVSYAGLGAFIDTPFYTYSEGMKLRLGFSIIAHTDPDIVILDENMSIGDLGFKQKSNEKIKDFFKKGKTVIMVSHQLHFIEKYCKKVIWLHKGKIISTGTPNRLISKYRKSRKEHVSI